MEFKLKNLFLATLSLFTFAACSDSEKGNDPEPTPPSNEVSLSIVGSSQVQLFNFEESRRFSVASQNVEDFYIETPTGWAADLMDDILTVVAPAKNDPDRLLEGDVVITYSGADGVEKTAVLQVKVDYTDPYADLTFEVSVTNIDTTTATISVIPSKDDIGYYYDVCTAEDYDLVEGNVGLIVSYAIQGMLQQQPGMTLEALLQIFTEYGPSSDNLAYLPSETDMYAFAIGLDKQGNPQGTPEVVPFRTLKGGDPKDCTFDLSVSNVSTTSCMVSIVPSDPSVRYWWATTSVQGYPGDEALIKEVEDTIKETVGAYPSMSFEEIINRLTFFGETHDNQYDLSAGVSYYIYAFAMDEYGLAAGPLFKYEFTTPLIDQSDSELEVSYKYFDGALISDLPEVANAYRLVVTVNPNEYTQHWVVNLAAADYTNEENYPQDATITAMMQANPKYDQIEQAWWIPKNTEVCTILAFGEDYDGVASQLTRIAVRPTPEGVSPVSEYKGTSAPRPEALMELQPKAKQSLVLKPAMKVGRQFIF
uniref:hypothetical protein n=1 Tax=Alistipes sp. TaxID=1872444 RepID=UPI00405735C8